MLWSLVFLGLLLAMRRQWAWLGTLRGQPKVVGAFAASAVLLSVNWVTYIWAVTHGHVVEASLGYFINPLFSVALGYTVLRERLRRLQSVALLLACAGVAWLTFDAGQLPWISLALAASFGLYGLLRKIASLGTLEGLTLETLLLAPVAALALATLWARGESHFPATELAPNLWLLAAGPITAIPLLLFSAGARRLSLATLGIVQYLSPTLQFLLAVWVFHEPFPLTRLLGFALIWSALLLYSLDGWRASRRNALAKAPGG